MKQKQPVGQPVKQKIANVGVNALARECGVSPTTISERMRRGQTAEQIRREYAARKGVAPTKRGKRSDGQGRAPSTPNEYDMLIESRARFEELESWKMRRQKALAERQEIENMLRRGELMPVSYARLWGVKCLTAFKDELLKGPSELQDALAAESDPVKCNAIVRALMERALAKLQQLEVLWNGAVEAEEVA